MVPDADELMNGSQAAQDGMVADRDVTALSRVVRENDIITDDAVMGDMGRHHKQAVIADSGHHAAAFGAGIHGDMFANTIVGTDNQFRRFIMILQILRGVAQGSEGIDYRSGTDTSSSVDGDMGNQFDVVPKFDISTDTAERTDDHIAAQPSGRIDDRTGVD
jgi:hypothetical protein